MLASSSLGKKIPKSSGAETSKGLESIHLTFFWRANGLLFHGAPSCVYTRPKIHMSHEKKTLWHSMKSWLVYRDLSYWLLIIPIQLGSISSPTSNNQPGCFFHCSHGSLKKHGFRMVTFEDFPDFSVSVTLEANHVKGDELQHEFFRAPRFFSTPGDQRWCKAARVF